MFRGNRGLGRGTAESLCGRQPPEVLTGGRTDGAPPSVRGSGMPFVALLVHHSAWVDGCPGNAARVQLCFA